MPAARKPEIMAPGGSWASLRAALQAGADAVYFGVRGFNMRRSRKPKKRSISRGQRRLGRQPKKEVRFRGSKAALPPTQKKVRSRGSKAALPPTQLKQLQSIRRLCRQPKK